MRKYIIGIFIGFCLSFAVGAQAGVVNMIGKVVDGEFDLVINNQNMEYKAIAIDGTTYAPVRMLGEATGYIVRFDDVTGVKLIKKIITPKSTVLKSIDVLNASISRNQDAIIRNEEEIVRLKKGEQTPTVLMDIQTAESSIERQKQGIVELNVQISKLNQTVADIDAQQTELTK